jgi:hypothetical protein
MLPEFRTLTTMFFVSNASQNFFRFHYLWAPSPRFTAFRFIESLREQDAKIDIWGAGTRLATVIDDPALGGVHKLSAVRLPGKAWQYKVKLAENATHFENARI